MGLTAGLGHDGHDSPHPIIGIEPGADALPGVRDVLGVHTAALIGNSRAAGRPTSSPPTAPDRPAATAEVDRTAPSPNDLRELPATGKDPTSMPTTDHGQAPAWVSAFMHEIDTLEFATAFATNLDQDTEMIFGTARVHGVEAIKDFFVKIDAPLITTHEVIETWTVGDVLILRGEATVAKRTDPGNSVCAPFTHIFYLDQGDEAAPRIRRLHITAGPVDTDALL